MSFRTLTPAHVLVRFLSTFLPFQLLDGRKSRHVAADDSGVLLTRGLASVPRQRGAGSADQAELHLAQSGPARAEEGHPGDTDFGKRGTINVQLVRIEDKTYKMEVRS